MAEDNLNLEGNIERAEELKMSFGSINNAVNELNKALRRTGEDTAEVGRVFAQLKTSADNVAKVQRSIQEVLPVLLMLLRNKKLTRIRLLS